MASDPTALTERTGASRAAGTRSRRDEGAARDGDRRLEEG
jgi:hypothetical protein